MTIADRALIQKYAYHIKQGVLSGFGTFDEVFTALVRRVDMRKTLYRYVLKEYIGMTRRYCR